MSGYSDPGWVAQQQAQANQHYEANRIAAWEQQYGQTVHAQAPVAGRWLWGGVTMLLLIALIWLLLAGREPKDLGALRDDVRALGAAGKTGP